MVRITDEDAVASRQRKLLGFGALVLLAALFAVVIVGSFRAAGERREAERWYIHTYDVLLAAGDMRTAIHAALRGERGFLLTGDPRFLRSYDKARRDIADVLPKLGRLTADNPRQRAHLAEVKQRFAGLFAYLDQDVAMARAGRRLQAVALPRILVGRDLCENLLAVIGRMEGEERHLLAARQRTNEIAVERAEAGSRGLAGLGVLLLITAAGAGASAVQSSKRRDEALAQLRQVASTDPLTGLLNRRVFFERLEAETSRSGRSGAPLSLAIIDVDHFKRVNDLHGHPAGDEVLRIVAEVARETMRASDTVARIGGEEFAVLMPETGMTRARRACERLREAVAARTMLLPGGLEASITLSSGIALLRQGEGTDALVSRADTALYAAKDGGRNQVRLAA